MIILPSENCFLCKEFIYTMTSAPFPGTMSTSSKLMTVLGLAVFLSIVLVTIFVMNIMWAPKEERSEVPGPVTEGEDEKGQGTSKGATIRNYIGVITSTLMLLSLGPGFYFANAVV